MLEGKKLLLNPYLQLKAVGDPQVCQPSKACKQKPPFCLTFLHLHLSSSPTCFFSLLTFLMHQDHIEKAQYPLPLALFTLFSSPSSQPSFYHHMQMAIYCPRSSTIIKILFKTEVFKHDHLKKLWVLQVLALSTGSLFSQTFAVGETYVHHTFYFAVLYSPLTH